MGKFWVKKGLVFCNEVCFICHDFEVENVVGADGLAPVFKELFDVDGDGQSLQLASPLGELADPLRRVGRGVRP